MSYSSCFPSIADPGPPFTTRNVDARSAGSRAGFSPNQELVHSATFEYRPYTAGWRPPGSTSLSYSGVPTGPNAHFFPFSGSGESPQGNRDLPQAVAA